VFRHFDDSSRAAEVEAAQARVIAARNRASHFAQMPSLKALLAERTGDAGWRRLRPPLVALSEDERSMLVEGDLQRSREQDIRSKRPSL
jgi:4-hydroxy-tetrahydrodipicolinate synthase